MRDKKSFFFVVFLFICQMKMELSDKTYKIKFIIQSHKMGFDF